MHCFNACSLSCSLLHCLCSIISIFLMVTNCQWVKLWNHQYVESPAFIFVHSRVTMGDSFLNTVARISTCGQQLFLCREDGLYMKLSLKLVLDRKQKKECGIQFCRKVRKPTTTRNHSARPVCTLLWRPTWHQKEPRQFKNRWTHHYTFGLFVCSLLHQAGQLTEVPLVLLQQPRCSITERKTHKNDCLVTWNLRQM